MKFFRSILFSAITLLIAPLCAEQKTLVNNNVQTKAVIFAFDMDDVMSISKKVGFIDFIGMLRIVFHHPSILSALINIKKIQKDGVTISKEVNGSTNVIYTLLNKLKEDGYGDLRDYADEIMNRSMKRKPIQQMVDAAKSLKDQGYVLIGATNQDWKQHLAYREQMRKHGVDLNEIFDAVLVTRVNHIQVPEDQKEKSFFIPVEYENMYAAIDKNAYKPHKEYYEILKDLTKYIASQKGITVDSIIFTDDKKENALGANNNGINGIHFELAGGSARKTSPEDLQKTVNNWKVQLNKKGIAL
ncbi:hypothetical protein KC460_05005 [Candidatus Dependentiae bacterium]|nr:hypothetical protein [Candidatus Dependentiae bacterium]